MEIDWATFNEAVKLLRREHVINSTRPAILDFNTSHVQVNPIKIWPGAENNRIAMLGPIPANDNVL